MIRRMEAREIGLLLEWDEDSEQVALAQGVQGSAEREVAYSRLIALQAYLREVKGVAWMDTELTERYRDRCGVSGMALIWRAEMRSEGGAWEVALAVSEGLGGSIEA